MDINLLVQRTDKYSFPLITYVFSSIKVIKLIICNNRYRYIINNEKENGKISGYLLPKNSMHI
ncbi:MAG: hypothetical protein ACI89P_001623 [Colwellia sp.]|jgi:hypothetical protein